VPFKVWENLGNWGLEEERISVVTTTISAFFVGIIGKKKKVKGKDIPVTGHRGPRVVRG
jgi:hypothetical protein